MAWTYFSRRRGDRLQRGRSPAPTADQTIAALNAEIHSVVLKRQRLQVHGAEATELEQNRIEIVRLQWKLSDALVARHAPLRAAETRAA
jgi:hypothetical protein